MKNRIFLLIFITIINFGFSQSSNNVNDDVEVLISYLPSYVFEFHSQKNPELFLNNSIINDESIKKDEISNFDKEKKRTITFKNNIKLVITYLISKEKIKFISLIFPESQDAIKLLKSYTRLLEMVPEDNGEDWIKYSSEKHRGFYISFNKNLSQITILNTMNLY
jgi:hypothetical protein